MGNGGYHGGSTVIGFGMRWSDAHDFPAPESHPTGAKPKNKKKKKARALKQKAKSTAPNSQNALLPFPPERIPLIASVMADIGRGLPRKAGKRQAAVKRLMDEGVVLPDGRLNVKHACLRQWLQKMEKKPSD